MRVSRLFTDQILAVNKIVFLDDKQSHYLSKVLRLKTDQTIILFNGIDQIDYLAQLTKIGKKVELLITKSILTNNESPIKITIFQALSKNEHIDFMLQKCTELGVHSIIIFNSQRTQIPLKSSKIDKKLGHWNRIVQSACEQCDRSVMPTIKFIPNFDNAIHQTSSSQRLMLDFNGNTLRHALNQQEVTNFDLLIGAEGGLSEEEINLATQHHFEKVRLGPRVLRTETAAISATALIQMMLGDLN